MGFAGSYTIFGRCKGPAMFMGVGKANFYTMLGSKAKLVPEPAGVSRGDQNHNFGPCGVLVWLVLGNV